MWSYRHWDTLTDRKEAIREAKKLLHGRVLKVETVWEKPAEQATAA